MVHVDASSGTVYLNAATVPRVKSQGPLHSVHHFLMVDMLEGQVEAAKDVWVRVGPGSNDQQQPDASSSSSVQAENPVCANVVDETPVLGTVYGSRGVVHRVWDAHVQQWQLVTLEPHVAKRHVADSSHNMVAAAQ
jgi:hypothetical protein